MFIFHKEIYRIARFPASKAFIDPPGGRNSKRRCFLIMERAQPGIIRTSPFQHNEFPYHFFNAAGRQDVRYGFPGDQIGLLFGAKILKLAGRNAEIQNAVMQ
jgi:hypothetical protein